jgi:hypothetical protein
MSSSIRLESVYRLVRRLPVEERGAFLADACVGDEDLRRKVESLVAEDTVGGSLGPI